MLTITTAQMDAIAVGLGSRFEQRLATFCRSAFEAEALRLDQSAAERGGLLGFVRSGIERAEHLEIDSDADIAVFIALILANLRLGAAKSDVLAWTRPMLEATEMPGALKIEWIFTRLADFATDDPDAAAALQWLQQARANFTA